MWRTILLTGENANDHDIALANEFGAAVQRSSMSHSHQLLQFSR
jgi:hypothetical protein